MPSGGYFGQVLFVDLSTGTITEESRDAAYYRTYLGGYGVGVETLFRRMERGVDPLGPKNILGFTTGLLTGTNAPFSGRYCVVGKSPLTGGWGDANSGGFVGPALKRTGYDAVFFTGRAEEPVYLFIEDGHPELRDARALWGEDCYRTDELIRKETGVRRAKIASIGPAGERLVRFACIINDNGRAAGRSGLGAVMGSKRLKALAVNGKTKPPIADPDRFKRIRSEIIQVYKQKPSLLMRIMFPLVRPLLPMILKSGNLPSGDAGTEIAMFKNHGTTAVAAMSSQCGDSPIKNWRGVGYRDFPMRKRASKISDEALDRYKKRKFACQACPIGCGALFELEEGEEEEGRSALEETHRPEYETIAEFGMMLLNDDPEAIIHANDICNRLGMDTISAGSTVAFAYECFERGIISSSDLDGLALEWGDASGAIELLKRIVAREGIGDILAEGSKRAAERFGGAASDAAIEVGGQELPMHDPRLNPSFATTYLTDPTPGRHTAGGLGFFEMGMMESPMEEMELPKFERYQYAGKGKYHGSISRATQVLNALGLCMFGVQFASYPFTEIIEAVTGWDVTVEELLRTGERIQALRQSFNVREGLIASELEFPARALGEPPLEKGPVSGVTIDLETMAKEFYRDMQWEWKTGRPSKRRLDQLGLDFVRKELY